jgi:hypothetical protein
MNAMLSKGVKADWLVSLVQASVLFCAGVQSPFGIHVGEQVGFESPGSLTRPTWHFVLSQCEM